MKAGFDGGFHLISQLKLTASPQGEAFDTHRQISLCPKGG